MRLSSTGLIALTLAAGLAGCAADPAQTAVMRSARPLNQSVSWTSQARLYRSVTVDRVSGGAWRGGSAQRSLERGLDSANLLAPSKGAARFALQVEFASRGMPLIGGDRGGHSQAHYRLIDRATGQVAFERDVAADIAGPQDDDHAATMVTRSVAAFVVQLAQAEHVEFATVVPCLDNAQVAAFKGALTAGGEPWRTDNCMRYRQRRADDGVRFSAAK